MLITTPSAVSGNWRANAWVSTNGARRFGSKWASQVARLASCHSSRSNRLALLTSTPIGPSADRAAGNRRSTSASLPRSARSTEARRPSRAISPASCSAAATLLWQCRATSKPASASPSAIARPSRCAAPVTRAARGMLAGMVAARVCGMMSRNATTPMSVVRDPVSPLWLVGQRHQPPQHIAQSTGEADGAKQPIHHCAPVGPAVIRRCHCPKAGQRISRPL